jgi:sugar lactone lactonase YvrE
MRLSIAWIFNKFFIAALMLIGGLHAGTVLAALTSRDIFTVAGTGVVGYTGDAGLATKSTLGFPKGIALDSAGNLYIADFSNNVIRMVAPNGIITTVAGTGKAGFSGDNGLATKATLYEPSSVAVDGIGNLYIADYGNNLIRMVAPSGIITTVAGTAIPAANTTNVGCSGDSHLATSAMLNYPFGVAVDGAGNLYIADSGNNVIRKVAPPIAPAASGIITTVAGTYPTCTSGYSGDNGLATNATLNYPNGVALDSAGNLYIADSGNNVIRMVSKGTITTFAGTGVAGYAGDNGSATSAMLAYPKNVAVDGMGNLYIADFYNHRIRMVSSKGTITTVAGRGAAGYSGDTGPATLATLYEPNGVAVNGAYSLYIADYGNSAVRMVADVLSQTVGAISFFPATLSVGGTATVSTNDTSGLAVSFSSLTPNTCTVIGSTVTATTIGTCTIAATLASNTRYQITQSISIGISRSDCIFNWAEQTYAQYFSPAGATDATYAPYAYRYYSGTGNYLAISSSDNNIYILGPSFGSTPQAVGPITSFLSQSGCP